MVTGYYATTGATWYGWTSGSSTGTAITPTAWTNWCGDTTTTAASTTTGTYWLAWQPPVEQKKQNRAQRRLAQRQEAERQAEAMRLAREAEAKREAAQVKAEALFLSHLTPQQEQAWRENRAIFVTSKSGRKFKLDERSLTELDQQDQAIKGYCVYVPGLPSADNLLAKKLALEHAEEELYRRANSWDIRNGIRV